MAPFPLPGFLTLRQAEPTGAVRKFLATVLDAIAGSSVQLVAPCAAAAICLLRVRLRAALKPTAVCVSSHATRVALPSVPWCAFPPQDSQAAVVKAALLSGTGVLRLTVVLACKQVCGGGVRLLSRRD